MFRSYTRTMPIKNGSKIFALFLSILIFAGSIGCAPKSEHRSPLANAYKLLDEGRNTTVGGVFPNGDGNRVYRLIDVDYQTRNCRPKQ